MLSTSLVAIQIKHDNNSLRISNYNANDSYLNCVINYDAARKLDFLILVIETLQINATETLFLKAKNIGLSDDFSSRVQFWKMRCTNPLRKSYTY